MGDVAMVASVLKVFQSQNHDTEIVLVTRKNFNAFFEHIPRILFHHIEPKTTHKGLFGLWKLYKELSAYKAEFFADLHHNLRSKILTGFFKLSNIKIKMLDKGREEKKALTRNANKVLKPLRSTTERYADVFRALDFSITLPNELQKETRSLPKAIAQAIDANQKTIGIAPFAQHSFKVLPFAIMDEVISYLAANNYRILIFGGGAEEKNIAEQWEQKYTNVISTIGKFTLAEELDTISHLDLMLSMDSSGMHMASLVGTRCVSIWGATHPFAGFLGYGQSITDCIQLAHPNRPSSVYGNKSCLCDGVEAIELVTSEIIINHIKKICE